MVGVLGYRGTWDVGDLRPLGTLRTTLQGRDQDVPDVLVSDPHRLGDLPSGQAHAVELSDRG